MPLNTALRPSSHRRSLGATVMRAGYVVAFGLAACSAPKNEVIARFPPDAGPDSALADTGASGAGSTPFVVAPTRGRVKVVDGNLVSDLNTPLRGLLLPVDTGWSLSDFDLQTITTYAQSMGLNTLHVYAEDSGQTTGSAETQVDAIVAQAGRVGMYVIIGVGTGAKVAAFDPAKLNEFWPRYASRFGDQPHVLFEIQNNPEEICSSSVTTATLDMEHAMYRLIRSSAPQSHILLLSATNLMKSSVLADAITNLNTDVDWSNASIDITINPGMPCQPLSSLTSLTDVAHARGVPLLIGQLPPTDWAPYLTALEQAKVGWMQYTFFADPALRTLDSYLTAVKSAGVTWCPDQGTFPEDASSCH